MVLLDATCMLLIAIGESLKNLDKTTDGKLLPTYPSILWKNVKGLRAISILVATPLTMSRGFGTTFPREQSELQVLPLKTSPPRSPMSLAYMI